MSERYFSILSAIAVLCHLIIAVSAFHKEIQPRVHVPSSINEGVTYEGKLSRSAHGRVYAAFNGIPYAKPPVGDLRFKPPVLLQDGDLSGIHPSAEEGSPCLQRDEFETGMYIGDEDCLFLNVFVPAMSLPVQDSNFTTGQQARSLLPVMIWIHGGGFILGSSDQDLYSATYLMDRDVVLVTLNYRLHVFGFLSTEDEEYPGNMGLLDQAAAIKWVNKNIKHFGGNPELVTIFGESAGGASAHFQHLSPHNEGLIHRVISQSGVANSPFALQPDALKNTQKIATLVKCPVDDKNSMMECLMHTPALTLTGAFASLAKQVFLPLVFVPRIDKEAKDPFVPDHPLLLMKQGRFNKVPWITGTTRDEGLMFTIHGFLNDDMRNAQKQEWEEISPLYYLLDENFQDHEAAKAAIEKGSFGHPVGSVGSLFDITRVTSELWFEFPAQEAIEAASQHVDTFAYVMDFASPRSWVRQSASTIPFLRKHPERLSRSWGTAHADDLPFLFKFASTEAIKEEGNVEEYRLKELFLDTFANFARTGNPNGGEEEQSMLVPWPRYDSSRSGSQVFVYKPTPQLTPRLIPRDRVGFWRSMFEKFGRPETRTVHGKDEL